MVLIDGKKVSAEVRVCLAKEAKELKEKTELLKKHTGKKVISISSITKEGIEEALDYIIANLMNVAKNDEDQNWTP